MKVLQLKPYDGLLVHNALKDQKVTIASIDDRDNYFQKPYQYKLPVLCSKYLTTGIAYGIMKAALVREYDIIYKHMGFTKNELCLALASKILGKKLVAHYHGSETRVGYGMRFNKQPDLKFVSTPDLIKWHPDAIHIKRATEPFCFVGHDNNVEKKQSTLYTPIPLIVHAPTHHTYKDFKGTEIVRLAIKELMKRKIPFRYEEVVDKSHAEARQAIFNASIVLDQFNSLMMFGQVGLEGMASGSISISTFDDESYNKYFPKLPLVPINMLDLAYAPNTILENKKRRVACILANKIQYWIENEKERIGLAKKGVQYTWDNHRPEVVAKSIKKHFEELLDICL